MSTAGKKRKNDANDPRSRTFFQSPRVVPTSSDESSSSGSARRRRASTERKSQINVASDGFVFKKKQKLPQDDTAPKASASHSHAPSAASSSSSSAPAPNLPAVSSAPPPSVPANLAQSIQPPPPTQSKNTKGSKAPKPAPAEEKKNTFPAYPSSAVGAPPADIFSQPPEVALANLFKWRVTAEIDQLAKTFTGPHASVVTGANQLATAMTQHISARNVASVQALRGLPFDNYKNPANKELAEDEATWIKISQQKERELSEWQHERGRWQKEAHRTTDVKQAALASASRGPEAVEGISEADRAFLASRSSHSFPDTVTRSYQDIALHSDPALLRLRKWSQFVTDGRAYEAQIADNVNRTVLSGGPVGAQFNPEDDDGSDPRNLIRTMLAHPSNTSSAHHS